MFGGDSKSAIRPEVGRGPTAFAIVLGLATLAFIGPTTAGAERAATGPVGQASAGKGTFRVLARPSRRATKPRGVIRVHGKVRPRAPRQRVLLQARLGGRWSAVGKARLSRRSTFKIPFRARRPGGQLLRVLKPRSRGHRASTSRVIRIVAMARRTVRSNGGKLRLELGPVRVIAPKGAIRKGKTLTIRTAPLRGPRGFSSTQAESLVGGPYLVSTSQGKPSRPVIVRLRYERGSLSEAGRPLVIHGWGQLGDWMPERTHSNKRIVGARLDSFSPLDVVDDITWWAGRITGNRTALPGNCGEVPSWITGVSFPRNRNEALPSCISNRTDAGALRVNIVNNRGYAQLVTVNGGRVAAKRSGSWTTSVDRIITNELARRSSGNGPSSFVLGPGASATIALDRPLDLVGQRKVVIRGAPRGGSAVAQLAWTLVSAIEKVKKKVAIPRSVTNCVAGVLYNSTSSVANATSSISGLRSCLEAGTGLSGIAKAALRKIGAAVLVTDVFHKVLDLAGDEAFPPRMEFVFQGVGKTNPDIKVGNLDVGMVQAGKATTWLLTAQGGSPPYRFAISTIPKNIGRVPDWVSLRADGTLSISPPAGNEGFFAFSVFVTDSTGRRSATGIYEVTFRVESDAPDASDSEYELVSRRLNAGGYHTCALRSDETVACWGENWLGQASPPPGTFKSVSAGQTHTCGVRVNGAVACWGEDDYGQSSPPAGVFRSVSAGFDYTCGVRVNDAVVCWGSDEHGESSPPEGSFQSVSANGTYFDGHHACGLKTSGAVACWGSNDYGQSSPPAGAFQSVGTGKHYSCGLRLDGSIVCWGQPPEGSDYGQASPPEGHYKSVSAGGRETCAIRADDAVICWGFNEFWSWNPRFWPPSAGAFSAVSVGGAHSCAIQAPDSTVTCWGSDDYGQTSVGGKFSAVSVGAELACALDPNGRGSCWGDNLHNKFAAPDGFLHSITVGGDGPDQHACALSPTGSAVCWGDDWDGQSSPPEGTFESISAGGTHTCAVEDVGAVACWGSDEDGQSTPPEGMFKSVSVGYDHSCGIRLDDTLNCWGSDDFGQSSPPIGEFRSISAGGESDGGSPTSLGGGFTCGLRANGAVECWGAANRGQTIAPSGTFQAVSAGASHACAIGEDGTVVCWGSFIGGSFPPGGTFTSIDAGYHFTCGVREDHSVECWGGRARQSMW